MSKTNPLPIDQLRFEDLSFTYDGDGEVFENVTIELPAHSVTVISGPSGSGKSTILKILAGLCPATAGAYYVNDKNVNDMSFEEFLGYRMNIGYSFDLGGLLNNRTLRDNLMLPMQYHGLYRYSEMNERVDEMLDLFNLTSVAHCRPSAVSGSRRKSTVVARSLILEPELLLLDEPAAGLTHDLLEALAELIQIRRDKGQLKHVFMTCDHHAFTDMIADKIIQIKNRELKIEEYQTLTTVLGKVAAG